MNYQESKKLEMLTKVADFAAKNVSLFPTTSAASEIVDALESGIRKLSDEAAALVSAETAIRSQAGARTAARTKLRTSMSRALQIAHVLNIGNFRLPVRPTEQALIDAGKAFVADIEPSKLEFVRHGLPLKGVTAAVEDMKRVVLDHTAAKETRSAALREWRKTMNETIGVLRRFDALVSNVLAGNPGATASYQVARAIPPARTRKSTPARPVVPPSPPAPAVPPAVSPEIPPAVPSSATPTAA